MHRTKKIVSQSVKVTKFVYLHVFINARKIYSLILYLIKMLLDLWLYVLCDSVIYSVIQSNQIDEKITHEHDFNNEMWFTCVTVNLPASMAKAEVNVTMAV